MYHLILDTDERDYIAQLVVDCDPPAATRAVVV